MKKNKLLFLYFLAFSFSGLMNAQETCSSDGTKMYFTTNVGWSASEYYKIIDIDAQTLGNSGMVKHTGSNGTATSTAWNSGSFTTPVYTYNEGTKQFEPTSVLWPVNYYLCCINDTVHNSAWSKVNLLGSTPSGNGDACYANDNSVITSPIWDKVGFIELSRQASEVADTPPSRHGYVEIDDLPMVERVQWSYSSTGWKRGVKLDIKYDDGEWQQLQWEPSDISTSLAGFSEQGYAFENLIGKGDDPTSKISLRWRIWDGDSINGNLTKAEDVRTPYTTTMTPYASKQVVRIHQIKVFAGAVPTEAPSGLRNTFDANIIVYQSKNKILLSEEATVSIFTVEGKPVYKGFTKSIDVSAFSKGIYIVRAVNGEGKTQNTKILL